MPIYIQVAGLVKVPVGVFPTPFFPYTLTKEGHTSWIRLVYVHVLRTSQHTHDLDINEQLPLSNDHGYLDNQGACKINRVRNPGPNPYLAFYTYPTWKPCSKPFVVCISPPTLFLAMRQRNAFWEAVLIPSTAYMVIEKWICGAF